MNARWFKHHDGMACDLKWLAVAEVAGATPELVSLTWSTLCEHASKAEERGSIDGFNPMVVAVFCRQPVALITHIIEAMRGIGVIAGNYLAAWSRRQTEDSRRALSQKKDAIKKRRQRAEKRDATEGDNAGHQGDNQGTCPDRVDSDLSESAIAASEGERERGARASDLVAPIPKEATPPPQPPPPPPLPNVPSDIAIDREFDRLRTGWRGTLHEVQARGIYLEYRRRGLLPEPIAAGAERYKARKAGEPGHMFRNLRDWLKFREWEEELRQLSLLYPLPGGAAAIDEGSAGPPAETVIPPGFMPNSRGVHERAGRRPSPQSAIFAAALTFGPAGVDRVPLSGDGRPLSGAEPELGAAAAGAGGARSRGAGGG